jgi:hypothetical protein
MAMGTTREWAIARIKETRGLGDVEEEEDEEMADGDDLYDA